MQDRHFVPGDVIFSEGDSSDLAYIIRSGQVEILKDSTNGPICLAQLGEGDVFGEMGLVDERPRSASARATDDVVAAAVDRHEFVGLLTYRRQESIQILQALFERLRRMNSLLIEQEAAAPAAEIGHRVLLVPLAAGAEAAVAAEGLEISQFPFWIGRKPGRGESEALAFNDVELTDRVPYTVSLNHFSIDLELGGVVIRDRGSRIGTIVNGTHIGGTQGRDSAPLVPGDNEVAIATPTSNFRFKLVVSDR
jgi:CRP-like cAMP-binding protein